jgi:DNA repair protein RadC
VVYEAVVKRNLKKQVFITDADDAYRIVKKFAKSRQEQCVLITMDVAGLVLGVHIIHIGTSLNTPVRIKEVFYNAIMDNADSLIVCHNHPSNNLSPSDRDLELADRLFKASEIMGIKIPTQMVITLIGYTTIYRSEKLKNISNNEKGE